MYSLDILENKSNFKLFSDQVLLQDVFMLQTGQKIHFEHILHTSLIVGQITNCVIHFSKEQICVGLVFVHLKYFMKISNQNILTDIYLYFVIDQNYFRLLNRLIYTHRYVSIILTRNRVNFKYRYNKYISYYSFHLTNIEVNVVL